MAKIAQPRQFTFVGPYHILMTIRQREMCVPCPGMWRKVVIPGFEWNSTKVQRLWNILFSIVKAVTSPKFRNSDGNAGWRELCGTHLYDNSTAVRKKEPCMPVNKEFTRNRNEDDPYFGLFAFENGYPTVVIGRDQYGRRVRLKLHAAMCTFLRGAPVPPANRCCHEGCPDNKLCVKPTHLQWGTCYDNYVHKHRSHWSEETLEANTNRHGNRDTLRTFPCYGGLPAEDARQQMDSMDKREFSMPFAELNHD